MIHEIRDKEQVRRVLKQAREMVRAGLDDTMMKMVTRVYHELGSGEKRLLHRIADEDPILSRRPEFRKALRTDD